jgi:hypothetical protein
MVITELKPTINIAIILVDAPYSVVANLSSSVILSKMFTFHTPAITDSIQPFYIRSDSTPRPEDITLAAFVPQDELSELASLVERYPGNEWNSDAILHCLLL